MARAEVLLEVLGALEGAVKNARWALLEWPAVAESVRAVDVGDFQNECMSLVERLQRVRAVAEAQAAEEGLFLALPPALSAPPARRKGRR